MGYKTYSLKEDGLYVEDWGGEEGVMTFGEEKLIKSHPNMAAGKKYDSASPISAQSLGYDIWNEVRKSEDKLIQMTGGRGTTTLEEDPLLEAGTAAKMIEREKHAGETQLTGEDAYREPDEKVTQQEIPKKEPDPWTPPLPEALLGQSEKVREKLKQIVSWQLAGSLGFDQWLLWKEADDEGMSTELTGIVDNRTQAYFDSYADGTWDYEKILDIHSNTFETWKIYRDDFFKDQGVKGKFEERTKDDIIKDYTGAGWNPFNLQGGSKNDLIDELLNWYKTNPATKDYNNQHLFDAMQADLNYINQHQGLNEENLFSIGPDGADGELLYFKIFGSGRGKITLDGTEQTVQDQPTPFRAGYDQTGWSDIYETHMRKQVGISSPSLWQHAMNQGIGNDPLQRTIYSQFQLQGTHDDYWAGDLTGSLLKQDTGGLLVTPGKEFVKASPDRNPYDEFLQTYRPVEGTQLTDTIGQVISTITKESWEGYMPGRGGKGDYSDEELRNFRWRENYLDGPNSEQHQKSLAALPIMQATPLALRAETSNMLEYLHTAWKSNPNRDVKEGWLEYVHKNNYFGMIPDERKDVGSQPSKSNYMERLEKIEADKDKNQSKDYSQDYDFEAWA